MPDFKIQTLDFEFTGNGQEVEGQLEADERFHKLASIKVLSNLYPVPAILNKFSIEGDSGLFETGVQLGFFQDVLTGNDYPINSSIKSRSQIKAEIKDNSPKNQPFLPYWVQIVIRLEKD